MANQNALKEAYERGRADGRRAERLQISQALQREAERRLAERAQEARIRKQRMYRCS
jgi:hypothetical protein